MDNFDYLECNGEVVAVNKALIDVLINNGFLELREDGDFWEAGYFEED